MNLYKLIEKQVQEETVKKVIIGAVIKSEEKYLVLKRASTIFLEGLYEIPTGNLQFGETIEECIYRVVEERIGCKVINISAYLGHFDYVSSDSKRARQYNFLVQINDINSIKLSDKHNEYRMATISDCENCLEMSDETLFILKTANIIGKFSTMGENL